MTVTKEWIGEPGSREPGNEIDEAVTELLWELETDAGLDPSNVMIDAMSAVFQHARRRLGKTGAKDLLEAHLTIMLKVLQRGL